MNILFYIPTISQDSGGIRQYSVALLNILSEDRGNNYFIYHNNNDNEIIKFKHRYRNLLFISDSDVRESFTAKQKTRVKRLINFLFTRILKKQKVFKIYSISDRLCRKYKIDIIHCPYQFIPQIENIKLITTLHDVQEIHFPEYFSPEERARRATQYLDFLTRANKVVVSYDHIKSDLIKYFSVPEEKIQTILLDMQKMWFERFLQAGFVQNLEYLKLPAKFLLYPANTWKHKNHIRLIEAIKIAKENYAQDIFLVCTGHKTEYFTAIQKKIEDLALQENVVFMGCVEEEILFSLYKCCHGVVVPTTYEAGSFPLIESLLLKVPVICSNVTSLPDTIDNDEFLFDPFSPISIANKLKDLWNSESFRERSIRNAELRATFISSNNALDKFRKLYSDLN